MTMQGARQYSIAFSDLVLAISAFYSASKLQFASPYSALGFCLVGSAALLGVLRFGVAIPRYHYNVCQWHSFMSQFATIVGIPLITAGMCVHHHHHDYAQICLVGCAAGFIVSIVLPNLQETMAQACSTFAVLGLIYITFVNKNAFALGGGAAYAVSGLLKGQYSVLGIRGINMFHYMLAAGSLLIMYGLLHSRN
ncbi:predicted protein [Nematostella vectensis]|uniref:Uncharacterized protein n=1 Tax=Nematostella vectensis TaxID=45351 RepID=A7RRI6_NEMVE|nr:uncharacterized protein LOC5518095 [Nematostella vectensis]EDO45959.1 predicted protein [Nematostella vectensis]|eukprot:XP_001638022.1 predicted protein [Nematostella vectensis]